MTTTTVSDTKIATSKVKNNKKKNKKTKKHEQIEDFKYLHSDLHEVLLEQGKEHREAVKPLRQEKHDIKHELVEEQLTRIDEINFHTYETHSVEDLLSDIYDSEEDEVLDSAFDDYLG